MHSVPASRAALQSVLARVVDGRHVFGASASLETGDGAFRFDGCAGNLNATSRFFIASTTKLFVTALVMKLRHGGKLDLEDPLTKYFDRAVWQGLLVLRGAEYGGHITVRQLLSHTSGLPDYFGDPRADGPSLQRALMRGRDRPWLVEHVIDDVKYMKPRFRPGHPGKAHYSDTNYQLLGAIVETLMGQRLAAAIDAHICLPLGLRDTYLYEDPTDTAPADMYFKGQPLSIPLAMASVGADGGIVSTSPDLLAFVKAFFKGGLFPVAYLDEMKRWNRIFFPLEYGVGVARFKLPRLLDPFGAQPELIGHSGLSGAFAFCAPEKDVCLAGTVNQIHRPSTSFRLMLRMLRSL